MSTARIFIGKHGVKVVVAIMVGAGGYWAVAHAREAAVTREASAKAAQEALNNQASIVQTATLENMAFTDSLVVQGNVAAKQFALVPARVPGVLDAIYVEEGDPTVAGETKLFQTETLKLRKAVEIAQQDLAAARCGQLEAAASLDKVRADIRKAEADHQRFERLYKKDRAVSADQYEQMQTRYAQAQAGIAYAETVVQLAAERKRQAESALEIAQKDLSDALVIAPINGRVSIRMREPGEMGEVGKPVVRIDDPSVVEISAFLPGESYGRVTVNVTKMRVSVAGRDAGEWTISYKSPTIDPRLRTFEVKCVNDRPTAETVPGAIAQVEVIFEQRTSLGIAADAIQLRDNGSVLFTIQDGKARAMPVTAGLQANGKVEVRGDGLSAGLPIVTRGQSFLKDGMPVTVSGS